MVRRPSGGEDAHTPTDTSMVRMPSGGKLRGEHDHFVAPGNGHSSRLAVV